MKILSRLIPVCSVATLVLAFAPPIANAAEPEKAEETTSSEEARPTTMREIYERALADAQLRPDQKKLVDELNAESEARHAPVKAAKGKLMMAVAEQIERGKIDRCELDATIDKLADAKAEAEPGHRASLERLHAILDKDQRAKFVTSLTDGFHALARGREPKAKLDKMAKSLGLSDDQRAKIEKVFATARDVFDADAKRAAKHERWAKILEGFKGDKFEIARIAPAEDREAKVKEHLDHALWISEAVLPILTHDQRMLVAEKMREKARTLAPAAEEEDEDKAAEHEQEERDDDDDD